MTTPPLEPQPLPSSSLPDRWSSRVPELADLPRLVELRRADQQPYTGSAEVDTAGIESEIAGPASWTRRQLVAVDPDGEPRAWASVHDHAAGRTTVMLYVDRRVDEAAAVAAALYAWTEGQARRIAKLRGVERIQLDASPFADDTVQRDWLTAAGYRNVRTWLHMTRPVSAEEAEPGALPAPRPGVSVRRVRTHANGVPVAQDLQAVHQMLEESFVDHFNSYRESFPEFVERLREDPGHRWDHWWLAEIEADGARAPAGALVSSVKKPEGTGAAGSYIDYIGVHRTARGRGVAKSLLYTVIADAAARGRDRVDLEVDATSPTGADGLYRSLGWVTHYATESWHKIISPA